MRKSGDDTELGGPNVAPRGFRRTVTSAFGATFAVTVADRLVDIAFLAILARILHPAEFGVVAGSVVVVSFLMQFSQVGLLPTLVQAHELTSRTLSVARTAVLCTAVLAVVAAQFFAPAFGVWFRNPDVADAVRLSSLMCIAQAISLVPHALLARQLRARDVSLVEMGCGILGTGCIAIPLALSGWGFWSLVVGGLVAAFAKPLALLAIVRTPLHFTIDVAETRRLWSRGAGFSLTVFLHKVATESDRLIVGRYLTPVSLGLYSRANGLMAMPGLFYGGVVDRVAFPAFSRVQGQGDRAREAYSLALSLTALVGLPLTVFLIFVGPDIIRLILGPAWDGAIAPFRILCVATYFRLADRVTGTLLRSLGKPYLLALLQAAICVAMICGCLVGVRHGLEGVATAVVLVAALSYGLLAMTGMVVSRITLARFAAAHLPGAGLALLTFAAAWLAQVVAQRFELAPFWSLATTTAIVGITVLIAIGLKPSIFLGKSGQELLKMGLDALPRRLRRQ